MKIIETNFKFNSNYTLMYSTPKGVVLHHAASTSCTASDVHSWHLARGYAGIGYHFFVDKNGNIYRGRPENWIGAHTTGYNKNIGICAEGNFESDIMSDKQKNAIIELIKYLNQKYGTLNIYRHKELNATACPGRNYPFAEIVVGSTSDLKYTDTQNTDNKDVSQNNIVNDTDSVIDIVAINLMVLEKGICCKQVEALQALLNQKLKLNLDIDGDFGSKTEIAVKNYQSSKNLDVDGIVGKQTWGSLLEVN